MVLKLKLNHGLLLSLQSKSKRHELSWKALAFMINHM